MPANTPITNTAYWELLGNYASLGEAVGATAAQVTVNTATIEQQGDDITAVSQTVSQHAARMPSGTGELTTEARVTGVESASVSRDSALGTRVGVVEARMPAGGGTLATASALSAESARITSNEGAITANSGAITQVSAGLGGSGNLLANSTFDNGTAGIVGTGVGAFGALTVNPNGSSYRPPGVNTAGRSKAGLVAASAFQDAYMQADGVTPGKQYCFSVYVGVHRASCRVLANWRDAAGGSLGFTTGQLVGTPPNFPPQSCTLADFQRLFVFSQAPAGAVSARLYWRLHGADNTDPVGWMARPMIEEAVSGQVGPSPWSEGGAGAASTAAAASALATAAAALDARVTSAEGTITSQSSSIASIQSTVGNNSASITTMGSTLADTTGKVNAAYTVTLNANGYVSGFKSENTGSSSTFTIAADKFVLASPGGGARTEFSGGNWRVYDGSGVLRVRMGVWA